MSLEVWIDDPTGARISHLDKLQTLDLIQSVNKVGQFNATISSDLDKIVLQRDNLLEFWQDGALEAVGFIRYWKFSGLDKITIRGPDIKHLLERRIVAYAAESAQSKKSDQADDMMKAIIRENFGASATDADRNLTSLGLTVEADVALGPTINLAFAYQNVLEALMKINEASRNAGNEVWYDLVPGFSSSNLLTAEFKTYVNQPGNDRRTASSSPVLIGLDYGNLENAELEYDYREEVNYVYVGGAGEGAERLVREVEDATAEGASVWNRIEGFVDARSDGDTSVLDNKGKAALAEKRGRITFSGEVIDTEQARYGRDWKLGDRVTARYLGQEYDCLIAATRQSVSDRGRTVRARLEAMV